MSPRGTGPTRLLAVEAKPTSRPSPEMLPCCPLACLPAEVTLTHCVVPAARTGCAVAASSSAAPARTGAPR